MYLLWRVDAFRLSRCHVDGWRLLLGSVGSNPLGGFPDELEELRAGRLIVDLDALTVAVRREPLGRPLQATLHHLRTLWVGREKVSTYRLGRQRIGAAVERILEVAAEAAVFALPPRQVTPADMQRSHGIGRHGAVGDATQQFGFQELDLLRRVFAHE